MWEPLVKDETPCAICRGQIGMRCINCQANRGDRVFFEWCRKLLMILLCGQRRVESYLSLLDINTMSIIYKWSIKIGYELTHCTTNILVCGHEFHTHCIEGWTKKRYCCPLDNKTYELLSTEEARLTPWRAKLVDCAVYEEPFEVRKRKKEDKNLF